VVIGFGRTRLIVAYSLYLHIPFCTVRCAYCDFNTYAGLEDLVQPYTDALCREISLIAASMGITRPVYTIFLGGGTPSLLRPHQHAQILHSLSQHFQLAQQCEITFEANPGTVSLEQLKALKSLGYNRISFGVQSAQPNELQLLDRLHSFEQVISAVNWARKAGFANLNLDLIYGLPYQALATWENTLSQVLPLGSEHLSLYALSLENGTPMRAWVEQGKMPAPDPDLAALMYEAASQRMSEAGYVQYEISNWAKADADLPDGVTPPLACAHNLQYWRNQEWLGLGAGAHGSAGDYRYSVTRSPRAYIERVMHGTTQPFPFSPAMIESETLDVATAMADTMLLGLRLTREGVAKPRFAARFGADCTQVFADEIGELTNLGLIENLPERVRLVPSAYLLANEAFRRFV
jgi:oxygen-independent coproporphyrinogen-3 oxidase